MSVYKIGVVVYECEKYRFIAQIKCAKKLLYSLILDHNTFYVDE